MTKLIFLILLCAFKVHAEWVLVQLDDGNIKPVYGQALHKEENFNIKESDALNTIYNEVLNYYKFPMIQMFWHEIPVETGEKTALGISQKDILEALEANQLVDLINAKLSEFCQLKKSPTYQIIDVPDTVFELAVLSFDEAIANSVVAFAESVTGELAVNDNHSFANQGVGELFKISLKESFDTNTEEENTPFQFMHFLLDAYNSFNTNSYIKDIYFATCNYLGEKFPNLLEEISKGETKEVSVKNFFESVKESNYDNKGMIDKVCGKFKNYSTKMLGYGSFCFDSAMQKPVDNIFKLYRGMKPVTYKNMNVLDVPDRGLHGYKNFINKYDAKNTMQSIVKEHTEIDADITKLNESSTSLSFGNSLLAGTFLESTPVDGGRAIDYLHKMKFGYELNVNVAEFLMTNPAEQVLLLVPLNTTMGLFGKGEFWHSRTKAKIQGGMLSGVSGGLLEKFPFIGFPNFLTLDKDPVWISSQITKVLSEKANIKSNQSSEEKKEILNNTKKVSELPEMIKHLNNYRNFVEEFKKRRGQN